MSRKKKVAARQVQPTAPPPKGVPTPNERTFVHQFSGGSVSRDEDGGTRIGQQYFGDQGLD